MKPRITFVAGSDVLSTNNREFNELPPINQELDFRDERYKVVGYRDATIELELVVDEPEPQRKARTSAKAKRTAKKQAKVAAKSKKASKTTGDGKTAATAVRGPFYNRKGN